MIKVIHNPLTENYQKLKKLILGNDFPWYWYSNNTYNGYYHHCFLRRPDPNLRFTSAQSQYINEAYTVVEEILNFNSITHDVLYRMSANINHSTESGSPDKAHYDHEFPHHNLLMYFSDTNGGYTMVEEEKYDGKEDDVIIFQGLHYNAPPSKGRRTVLITTFM